MITKSQLLEIAQINWKNDTLFSQAEANAQLWADIINEKTDDEPMWQYAIEGKIYEQIVDHLMSILSPKAREISRADWAAQIEAKIRMCKEAHRAYIVNLRSDGSRNWADEKESLS